MMRSTPLGVRAAPFDWGSRRGDVEAIALCFGEYLAQAGVRHSGAGSKHRALGAVGKALQHARIARGDALLGYARRVHEQLTQSSFPAGAVEKLDEGLRKLDALLGGTPRNVAGLLLDRVGYATYYDVKRRFVEFQHEWLKYVEDNAKRLGLPDVDRGKPVWFSRKLVGRGPQWKRAIEEFLASRREGLAIEDEAEEDQE